MHIIRHRQRQCRKVVHVVVYPRNVMRTVVGKIFKLFVLCVKRITYEDVV